MPEFGRDMRCGENGEMRRERIVTRVKRDEWIGEKLAMAGQRSMYCGFGCSPDAGDRDVSCCITPYDQTTMAVWTVLDPSLMACRVLISIAHPGSASSCHWSTPCISGVTASSVSHPHLKR